MTPEIREQVRLYRARAKARAIAAKLTRANPVGPRHDEVNGQVPEQRGGGAPDPFATGPRVEWSSPEQGQWVSNGNGSERFVPNEHWRPRVAEASEREPSVPQIAISSRRWRNTPSGPVQD